MQDLIERRAALTALCEDCLRKYDGICPHPASRCVEFRTIKQLPAIKPKLRADWIPCSERLPESVGNKVLVFCTGDAFDYFGLGHYEKFKGIETWYNTETGWPFADQGLTVTHWMPRPEPPEKEDGDG